MYLSKRYMLFPLNYTFQLLWLTKNYWIDNPEKIIIFLCNPLILQKRCLALLWEYQQIQDCINIFHVGLMPKRTTICHMFISRCLVRYEHFCVIKTTKNELIFRSINRYRSFPALTVRFITRRFIGDYDPDLGRSNSDAVTLAFMIKSQGHLTVKKITFEICNK